MNQKGQIQILIGILILVVVASGAYFLGKSNVPKSSTPVSQTSQPTPSSTPAASPAPTGAGETANWKTYTSTKYRYSFKYNPELKLIDQNGRLSVTNNNNSTSHYFNISINVSDNSKNQTTQEFVDSAKILTASNVYKNPYNSPQPYVNGNINGIIADWNNGDDSAVDVLQATKTKIYDFGLLAGPGTGTLPTTEDKKTFDQILSTFRFLP